MDVILIPNDILAIIFSHIDTGSDWKAAAFTCKRWSLVIHKTRADGPITLANHLKTLIKLYPDGIGSHWKWRLIAQNPNIDLEYINNHPILYEYVDYFANNPNATPEDIITLDPSERIVLTNTPSLQFIKDNPDLLWSLEVYRDKRFSLGDIDDEIEDYEHKYETMTKNINYWRDQYEDVDWELLTREQPVNVIANPSTSFEMCKELMSRVNLHHRPVIMENPNITLEFVRASEYQYHARSNPAFTIDECAGFETNNTKKYDQLSLHPKLTWKYVRDHPEIEWKSHLLSKNLFTRWQPGDYHLTPY